MNIKIWDADAELLYKDLGLIWHIDISQSGKELTTGQTVEVSIFLLLHPPQNSFRALSVGRRNLGLPLNVWFEVLTAVTMKCMVFWIKCRIVRSSTFLRDIWPPSSGSKNKPCKKPTGAGSNAGLLLLLTFDPEDWDYTFFRNVALFSNLHAITTQKTAPDLQGDY